MTEVRLDALCKSFGKTAVVKDLSVTVRQGEFLVLLGPSGCGKSTTLRMIAGLEDADSGRILIDGRDVTGLPPSRRGLAMVFQYYALFPHLTVAENIVFGLRVRRMDRVERDRRLHEVAAMVGLEAHLTRRPAELSGGQRQRVALARAIAARHPLCLMDEPLSNLDARLRHDMRVEIRALQRRLGMTVIYVTHDQIEAMSMADRVVLMRDGRIEQQGTPEDIYARPETDFVARFIGTPPMNLIRLADGPRGAVIAGDDAGLPVLAGPGDGLTLGLRPEQVRLAEALPETGPAGGPATDAGPVRSRSARVVAVDYHGPDTVVSAGIGGQILQVRAAGHVPARMGQEVRLSWSANAVHLFGADGRRRSPSALHPV